MKVTHVFLTLLLISFVSITAMAGGQKDFNDDSRVITTEQREFADVHYNNDKTSARRSYKNARYGKDKKGRHHRRMIDDIFSQLSHGELSDQEKADMESIYEKGILLDAIEIALLDKKLEIMKEKYPNKQGFITRRGDKEFSRMGERKRSFPLIQLADSYSYSLNKTEPDNAFASQDMDILLNTYSEELLAYADLLEKGYSNADDEDIQVTYLFLQKRAVGRLVQVGENMMTQGITPPQSLIDAVNMNDNKYASFNKENYPQLVLDAFEDAPRIGKRGRKGQLGLKR